jgi:hypothetical protein
MNNPLLTLPPVVGATYLCREDGVDEPYEVVVSHEDQDSDTGDKIWIVKALQHSTRWLIWPDGRAKIPPHGKKDYVAELTEDILIITGMPVSSEFEALRAKKDKMMARLKELEA